jgi:hypothetical protein
MAHFFKFGPDEIFRNRIETHPEFVFTMVSGNIYLNNEVYSGSMRATASHTGSVSLYEINVNRISGTYHSQLSGQMVYQGNNTTIEQPFFLVNQFFVKDGNNMRTRNVTTASYNQAEYGQTFTGSYPLTSSIARDYIVPAVIGTNFPFRNNPVDNKPQGNHSTDLFFQNRKRMIALGNIMNEYSIYNPLYYYSSSNPTKQKPFLTGAVNLISIPGIFYGSGIEKGSVCLEFYYTGTLIDRATDDRQTGALVSTMGGASGSEVGVVLYNEGFIVIGTDNAQTSISTNINCRDSYLGNGAAAQGRPHGELDFPKWIYFASHISGTVGYRPSASLWNLKFRGTNYVPTLTMYANAQPGELNNSQNPTWLSGTVAEFVTGQVNRHGGGNHYYGSDWKDTIYFNSSSYMEPEKLTIKNTIQSDYCEYEDKFEKQVFISEVGIFDDDKNLLGIAKMATPVQKKETDSYTFKIKMDF